MAINKSIELNQYEIKALKRILKGAFYKSSNDNITIHKILTKLEMQDYQKGGD